MIPYGSSDGGVLNFRLRAIRTGLQKFLLPLFHLSSVIYSSVKYNRCSDMLLSDLGRCGICSAEPRTKSGTPQGHGKCRFVGRRPRSIYKSWRSLRPPRKFTRSRTSSASSSTLVSLVWCLCEPLPRCGSSPSGSTRRDQLPARLSERDPRSIATSWYWVRTSQ